MGDSRRQPRWGRLRALGALCAVCSLVLAATAPAAEDPTIFTMGPAMHAVSVTIGPDGNLWFAAASSSSSEGPGAVGRVAPDGTVVEFGLQEKSQAGGIVTGADGALWFTEPQLGRIGRVALDGAIATFPLPNPASQPLGIAAGGDGNLWFTEFAAGKIGRVTPAGAIDEFPLAPDSKPVGIAAGPDGNLWFTEYGGNRIGRITPAGQIAEFPLSGTDPRPNRIVTGPDGNLWFTYGGANRIGRITSAGAVADFPVPTATGTQAIAAGPDGNLWFSSSGEVGALAPNGRLARLSCLKAGCRLPAIAMATGTGGEIWAGTSTEFPAYGGGGSYINTNLTQPGYLVRFLPRATTTELTSAPPPVRHRRTRLQLSCGSEDGCHGVLRLIRRRAVFPGESGRNFAEVPIGRGWYHLDPGESVGVLVGLNRRAAKLLSKRPLTAWVLAEAEGGDLETARLVTLRRSG
jgi:streptogramin lyase